MSEPKLFTSYSDLDVFLRLFVDRVRVLLGECLVGIYLHGSLALGDFEAQTSDIDFVVVTKEELSAADYLKMQSMHAALLRYPSPWATKLEGAYIPKDAFRRHDSKHATHPWLGSDGHFAVEHLSSDWVLQRHVLRTKGIVLVGPPLSDLIDVVTMNDIKQACRDLMRSWWTPPFASPERFEAAAYQRYTVLTMCRMLVTQATGEVVSKPVAARWCLEHADKQWQALIGWAVAKEFDASKDRKKEALDFIRFVAARMNLDKIIAVS